MNGTETGKQIGAGVIVLVLLVVGSISAHHLISGKRRDNKVPNAISIRPSWLWSPQGVQEEEWKHFDDPRGIECGPFGELIVADSGNSRVVRFWEGGQVEILGGYGRGPGEFVMPVDLYIDHEDSSLWVVDSANATVSTYALGKSQATFIESHRIGYVARHNNPSLVVAPNGGSFYFTSRTSQGRILEVDYDGTPVGQYGENWAPEDGSFPLRNRGYINLDADNRLVFVGRFVPRIEAYSLSGELLRSEPFREEEIRREMENANRVIEEKGWDGAYAVPIVGAYIPAKSANIYIISSGLRIDVVDGTTMQVKSTYVGETKYDDILFQSFCVREGGGKEGDVVYVLDRERGGILKFTVVPAND